MRTITEEEARVTFPELMQQVRNGEVITITDAGVPVAKISPLGEPKKFDGEAALARIRELRKGVTLGDISIRELIEEGRRY